MLKNRDKGGLTGYMFIKEDQGFRVSGGWAEILSQLEGAEIVKEEKCSQDGSVVYVLARSVK